MLLHQLLVESYTFATLRTLHIHCYIVHHFLHLDIPCMPHRSSRLKVISGLGLALVLPPCLFGSIFLWRSVTEPSWLVAAVSMCRIRRAGSKREQRHWSASTVLPDLVADKYSLSAGPFSTTCWRIMVTCGFQERCTHLSRQLKTVFGMLVSINGALLHIMLHQMIETYCSNHAFKHYHTSLCSSHGRSLVLSSLWILHYFCGELQQAYQKVQTVQAQTNREVPAVRQGVQSGRVYIEKARVSCKCSIWELWCAFIRRVCQGGAEEA